MDIRLDRLNALWRRQGSTWVLLLGLFAIALVVRLPNLMLVPRFNDEGQEILWGLDIALGRRLPLGAGINSYYGPLYSYLIAALFRIFGVSIELPRLTVAVFGALTVTATYGLGRLMWNRLAGLVAAGFVLTCPILILHSSHTATSAALPPFFVTVTLAAFYAANVKNVRGLLLLSGLLAALTLQTHPITGVILFGMALWYLTLPGLRVRLKKRELYCAIALFILGCAPMILNVIQTYGFFPKSVQEISGVLSPTLAPGEYLSRLVALLKVGGFYLGGGIGTVTVVLRVEAIALELLLLAALIASGYRGNRLIPLVVVTSILILPAALGEQNERYFIYLLPAAYVAVGGLTAESWRGFEETRQLEQPARLAGAGMAAMILLGGLVAFPLISLRAYYDDAFANGLTNEEYFRLAGVVQATGMCGPHLRIEDTPKDFSTPLTTQAWFALHAVDTVLALDGCEHRTLTARVLEQSLSTADQGGWLILTEQSHATLSERFDLQVITTVLAPPIESTVVPVFLDRVSP
jgi:4-amino-4-deoxy-L-arabinose transferase-like glycosyltransferase